mmetsp:Transcript_37907/g.51294  ORF Transcript_37907/g.51294 Transcript_37907/m.51294 type:complete len:82 (+) Transcript_37907:723-968(+)
MHQNRALVTWRTPYPAITSWSTPSLCDVTFKYCFIVDIGMCCDAMCSAATVKHLALLTKQLVHDENGTDYCIFLDSISDYC